MGWWILAAMTVSLIAILTLRAFKNTNMRLYHQGTKMNWLYNGNRKDRFGHTVTMMKRQDNRCHIHHKHKLVYSDAPYNEIGFKDFVELERWLANFKAEYDAIQMLETEPESELPSDLDPDAQKEIRYYQSIELWLKENGEYYDNVLLSQWYEDFMDASKALYRCGYKKNISHNDIGSILAKAGKLYDLDPNAAVSSLRKAIQKLEKMHS